MEWKHLLKMNGLSEQQIEQVREITEKVIEDSFIEFLHAKQHGEDFGITLEELRNRWLASPPNN